MNFDTIFNSPDILLAIFLWSVVTWRVVDAFQHRGMLSAKRQAWFVVAIYLCIPVTYVLYLVGFSRINLPPHDTSIWAVPPWLFAIFAYMLTATISYDHAPTLRPSWNWHILAGALAVAACVLLAVKTQWIGFAGLIFAVFILVVVIRAVLPSLILSYRHELQSPMRLRLLSMIGMHAGVALWMLISVLEGLWRALGVPVSGFPEIYTVLQALLIGLFVVAYLFPMRFHLFIVRSGIHFSNLGTFFLVRYVQMRAYNFIQRQIEPVSVSTLLIHPEVAVYESIIAILDAQKSLERHDSGSARHLGQQLESAMKPDAQYNDVVKCIWQIGAGYTFQARGSRRWHFWPSSS